MRHKTLLACALAKNTLSATGDPTFSASLASFSASGLPDGISLSTSDVLSGTPTVKQPAGASFQVTASYKTQTGQQAYTIVAKCPWTYSALDLPGGRQSLLTLFGAGLRLRSTAPL